MLYPNYVNPISFYHVVISINEPYNWIEFFFFLNVTINISAILASKSMWQNLIGDRTWGPIPKLLL